MSTDLPALSIRMRNATLPERFITTWFGNICGNFLDIGSHDGYAVSLTVGLTATGWSGTLVEPNPLVFDELCNTYMNLDALSRCNLMRLAIVPDDHRSGFIPFYIPKFGDGTVADAWGSVSDSWYRNGERNGAFTNPVDHLQSLQVRSITMSELLAVTDDTWDFVKIDAEGMSDSLARCMDWTRLHMNGLACIEMENPNIDCVIDEMNQKGLAAVCYINPNIFFTRSL